MSHVELGISPIGWTNQAIMDLGEHISYETCISEAAKAGFRGMELGRKFPEDSAELLRSLDAVDMKPVSAWYSGFLTERSVAEEWRAAQPCVNHLLSLDCKVLVYGECGAGPAAGALAPLDQSPPLSSIDLESYAARMTVFAEQVQQAGLTLAYHSHVMMPVEANAEVDLFMAAAGPAVRLLLDTGHIAMSGGDYVELMEKWWSRIAHIHLKDMRKDVFASLRPGEQTFDDAVRAGIFTVPGDGDIDFAPLIKKIAQDGYDGLLLVEAEQDPLKAPPLAMAKSSFKYLDDLLRAHSIHVTRNANFEA